MFSDVLVGMHESVIIQLSTHVGLKWTKDTHIQWLELVCGVRRQGYNDNAMLDGKLHSVNVHVTFSIVHDKQDLVVYTRP